MVPTRLLLSTLFLPIAIILNACGGSSSPGADTQDPPAAGVYGRAAVSSGTASFESVPLNQPLVTHFEDDGAGGLKVNYRFDGAERLVSFTADDYNRTEAYHQKRIGNWEYILSNTDTRPALSRMGISLTSFEYFDSYFVEVNREDPMRPSGAEGYFVHGRSTLNPPTGTASYSGRFEAKYYHSAAPQLSKGYMLSDELSLVLDFADNSVNGSIDNIKDTAGSTPDNPAFTPVSGRFNISGTISGNSSATVFTATMEGTEDVSGWNSIAMEGRAFGPLANEAGGVLRGTNADNGDRLLGYFGARKR